MKWEDQHQRVQINLTFREAELLALFLNGIIGNNCALYRSLALTRTQPQIENAAFKLYMILDEYINT